MKNLPIFFAQLIRHCLMIAFLLPATVIGQNKPFVHPLFSSNMVLQRNASVPVWGWTTPNAVVSVSIGAQTHNSTANAAGRWQVNLNSVNAGGPYSLTVTGGQTATFNNILFGDVFLCSGQSNMEWSVNSSYNSASEIADSANYPNIRCFTVTKVPSFDEQETLTGGSWRIPGSSTTGSFSATAYFMAREIYKQQNIPIGIVVAAWGGTQIQSWVDLGTSENFADSTQTLFDQRAGTPNADTISGHFNGMISPLAPFAFKAAVWYQGEFNAGRGQQYSRLLPSLLSDWRARFGANLPFLVVQLPNNDAKQVQPVETGGWAEIREAQSQAVQADQGRSRIVNIIDLGEGQLHPLNKQDVGLRTSWAAANLLYGQSVVNQGPVFEQATQTGNSRIRCTFTNVGAGLMVASKNASVPMSGVQQDSGTVLKGFAIAGADHNFYLASASIINSNTVEIYSPMVTAPQYVRYAWANNPDCNLYNKITNGAGIVINGLPAGSFRNDPVYKLNVNAGGGGRETFVPGSSSLVTASVPAGQAFHHWGGDTSSLSGSGNPVSSTLSNRYVTVRAYFQITSAPSISVSAEVGKNVVEWSSMADVHYRLKRGTSSSGPFQIIADNLLGVTRYVDSSIAGSQNYYYAVSAFNEVNEGPNSAVAAVAGIPYVRGFQAVPGAAMVSLSWSPLSGAASYDISRSEFSGGPYETVVRAVAGTSYVDRAVAAGGAYYYVVSANTSVGTTAVSPEVVVRPEFLSPPMKNQDIGAVGLAGSASVNLAGNLVIKASGADIAGALDEFHYAHVALTGDCSVTAKVASLDSAHVFAKAGVMLRSALNPDSPYALAMFYGSQTNAGNQFRLTAGAAQVSTGGAGSNRWLRVVRTGNVFTTYSSADGGSWSQMGAAQTIVMPATIYAGLAFSSHNDFQLDTATFSNISGISLQAPAPPQSLSASVRPGDGGVLLTWAASPGAAAYKVKRSNAASGPFTVVADGILPTQFVPINLAAGSTFYYAVSAITGAGESVNSAVIAVAVPSIVGLPAPSSVSATAANAQIRLEWKGPAAATGYKIKRATQSSGPFTTVQETVASQFVDTGLTNGTVYYYVVATKGVSGDSLDSYRVSVAPRYEARKGAIRAIANGRYVSSVGSAALIANKDLIGSTELFDLLELGSSQIAIRATATGNYVTAPNGGGASLAATQSSIGNAERFTVTYPANNRLNLKALINDRYVAAESGGSQPLIANRTSAGNYETFEFIPVSELRTPAKFVACAAYNSVELEWSAISGATTYLIQRSLTSGSGFINLTSTTANRFNDTTPVNGTTYYYKVSAVTAAGVSAASAEVASRPDTNLLVTLNRSGWTASTSSGQAAAAAIDGNQATRWTSGAIQQSGQWFQVDMGSSQLFSQLTLDANTSTSDYPRGYEVRVSSDGINWSNPVASGVGTSATTAIQFSAQNARYIRVIQTGNSGPWWSIHEFNALYQDNPGALSSPWQAQDVGLVGNVGTSSYSNDVYYVSGSGADIGGTADGFHYINQQSSGDCSVIAKVSNVGNTNASAKAGLMIRETILPNSVHAAVFVTPTAGVIFQVRTVTGGSCSSVSIGGTFPQWIKITRLGNLISSYISPDGLTWTQVGVTQPVSLASTSSLGLAVTARDNSKICTGVFESVVVVP